MNDKRSCKTEGHEIKIALSEIILTHCNVTQKKARHFFQVTKILHNKVNCNFLTVFFFNFSNYFLYLLDITYDQFSNTYVCRFFNLICISHLKLENQKVKDNVA